jgi:hypothetical protein
MNTFKITIRKAHILLLYKKLEVEVSFTIFYEAELMKLVVFDN